MQNREERRAKGEERRKTRLAREDRGEPEGREKTKKTSQKRERE